MKKRLFALLILLFMVFSLLIPFLNNSDTNLVESKPVMSSKVCTVVVQEIVQEQDSYESAIIQMNEQMDEIKNIEDSKEWFIAYKNIIDEYSHIIDSPETVYDYFSDEEIYLIQRTVETECYDMDFDAKCNVANVVLNRLESGEFGNTVEEVITSQNQFAYSRKEITEDTVLALEFAFSICDTTYGSVAFRSDKQVEEWYEWEYVFSDDGHHFYK